MASSVPPVRGAAFDLYFTLYKNDGTVIANPGTYTLKVSKDGGAVATAVNTVTEVDTTYGLCKLTLSATEMTADSVWVQIKDDTTGCIPFTIVIYTAAQSLDTVDSNVDAILADTGTDGVVVAASSKTGYALTDAYTNSLEDIAGTVWDEPVANHSTTGTYGAVGEWAGSVDEAAIADAIWDEALAGHATAGTTGEKLGNMTVDMTDIAKSAELLPLATSEQIEALDSLIDAIKSVTDQIRFTVANRVDSSATANVDYAAIADSVWDEASAGHAGTGTMGAALSAAKASSEESNVHAHNTEAKVDSVIAKVDDVHADIAVVDGVADAALSVVSDIHDTDLPSVKADSSKLVKYRKNKRHTERTENTTTDTIYDDDGVTPLLTQTVTTSAIGATRDATVV